MRKCLALLLVLVFLTSLVTLPQVAVEALFNIIIVPDDYPTLTAAICNASKGDTILVRSGTYEGPINSTIVIDKSVCIIGENNNTIINLYPAYNATWILGQPLYSYSDAITITADSCSLQDLTIQMAKPGGSITTKGNQILIANNRITAGKTSATGVTLKGSNCRVTNNVIEGAITVNGTYNQVDANSASFIDVVGSYNFIKDNTCQGLGLAFSTNNVFLENRALSKPWGDSGVDISRSHNNFLYKNEISGFIYGLRFYFSSNNTIKANTATDSLSTSLIFCASNDNLVSLNNFANNTFASTPFVYDRYSDISIRNSIQNLTLSTNTWSDHNLGNYWGDYYTKYPNASEIDSTGVGNIPYIINDNNTDPYPLITNYDISTASIQLPYWTNLNLPVPRPTPSFPLPLSTSPSPTASPSPSPSASPLPAEPFPTLAAIVISVVSATLVGAGLVIYFKKRKP